MIARKDAQAARINRQGSVNSEFGGKVCDRLAREFRKLFLKPARRMPIAGHPLVDGGIILTQKIGILGSMLHPGGADLVQQFDGIVLGVAPKIRIEPLEEQPRTVIPAPFKVTGQSPKHRNAFGKVRESVFSA